MSTITVIIPAFNEEERIAGTIRAILERRRHQQLIVVDDGSTDLTPEIAAQFPVELIKLPTNQGKAAAVTTALRQARGEIIVLLDADLGQTAKYYPRLIEPLLTGEARMAVAVLTSPKGSGGVGLVKRLARLGMFWLTGRSFPAVLSGQRAFFKADLPKLTPLGEGFGLEFALTVLAVRARLAIAQVPLPMEHAYTGKDLAGYLHRYRQFQDIFRTMVKLWKEGRR
ncbi:MAG: glycosyltransferase family 2 protein [Firmicutes bacterium]|nr:glycosyltransferase family 2 protein [Bacillota bacterium]